MLQDLYAWMYVNDNILMQMLFLILNLTWYLCVCVYTLLGCKQKKFFFFFYYKKQDNFTCYTVVDHYRVSLSSSLQQSMKFASQSNIKLIFLYIYGIFYF